MARIDLSHVCERIAALEVDNNNQSKKINEIHKILVGNGRIGLVDEWNQWKGAVKLFGIVMGAIVSILGVVVGFLAYAG